MLEINRRMEIWALNNKFAVLETAEAKKSGSFVLGICEALQHADHTNVLKLVKAFPEYFCDLYEFHKKLEREKTAESVKT